ncbi:MAG: hypothetical protein MJ164_01075 [Alphaproteobacteria bacterium]|nr:hypothetical protein [Alphaproteobacteria bacterium]
MKKHLLWGLIFGLVFVESGYALQYNYGRSALKFNVSGQAGVIEPDFHDTLFLGDFELRAQYNYAVARGQTFGLVYEWDEEALSEHDWAHDAFALYEVQDLGRVEIGLTHSVTHKLSVGIPDVGGLRVNHNPLFYKRISPDGNVIPNTHANSGHDAPRVNLVSVPTNVGQYGVSVAAFGEDYDYAVDGGVKFRFPNGKIKSALSLGASFMNNLDGFSPASYLDEVTADWRAQGSVGFNIQYNSWIFGTSAVAIYDKNPVGAPSDGISVGSGVSYDILNYSLSLSYLYSKTGVWHRDLPQYYDHTVIGSFRYKYSENMELWTSVGLTTKTPFLATALKVAF